MAKKNSKLKTLVTLRRILHGQVTGKPVLYGHADRNLKARWRISSAIDNGLAVLDYSRDFRIVKPGWEYIAWAVKLTELGAAKLAASQGAVKKQAQRGQGFTK